MDQIQTRHTTLGPMGFWRAGPYKRDSRWVHFSKARTSRGHITGAGITSNFLCACSPRTESTRANICRAVPLFWPLWRRSTRVTSSAAWIPGAVPRASRIVGVSPAPIFRPLSPSCCFRSTFTTTVRTALTCSSRRDNLVSRPLSASF